MRKELTKTEIMVEFVKKQIYGEIVFYMLCNVISCFFFGLLVFGEGAIVVLSTLMGTFLMVLALRKVEKRIKSGEAEPTVEAELPLYGRLYEGYGDESYIRFRKYLLEQAKERAYSVNWYFVSVWVGILVFLALITPISTSRLLDQIVGGLFFSFPVFFTHQIFEKIQTLRILKEAARKYPIETLPPTVERWLKREEKIAKGKRPTLVTGLAIFYYVVGFLFLIGGILEVIIWFFPSLGIPSPLPLRSLGDMLTIWLSCLALACLSMLTGRLLWKMHKAGGVVAVILCFYPLSISWTPLTTRDPCPILSLLLIVIPLLVLLLLKRAWRHLSS